MLLVFIIVLIGCPPKPPDPPPEQEYEYKICIDSGKMRNTWCPPDRIEIRKFTKENIPTEWCDFHKEPEPPIPQFDELLSFQTTGKFFSPLFCKGGLFLKNTLEHYTDADFRKMIDEVAANNYANIVPMFIWYNAGASLNDQVNMPHLLLGGKHNLHTINMIWWNQVKERIKYCYDRNITVSIIINDQGTIRRWDDGWLHCENNSGWNGQETYFDHYGWTKWVHLSDPNYGNEDERARLAATRDYLFFMYDFMLSALAPYKEFLLIENNEIDAGSYWHDAMADILDAHGYGKDRRITSIRRDALDWFLTKPNIRNRWMIEIHSIFTLEDYAAQKSFMGDIPFIPSGDGGGEAWWIHAGPEGIATMLLQSLQDGNLGYIGNTEGTDWGNMDYTVARAMRDAFISRLN